MRLRLSELCISALLIALMGTFVFASGATQAQSLAQTLSGKILLQVEENGEAWYVYPETHERFFMGRPNDAFNLMRTLGLGISNANLEQIPEAGSSASGNFSLRNQLSGKILLQVEANGEAWYVNPDTLKRHFMGRPDDAFNLMRSLGLGISTKDLIGIPVAPDSVIPDTQTNNPESTNTEGGLKDGLDPARNIVLSDINKDRKANGIANLMLSVELSQAAQAQANDMEAKNYFDFESPTGQSLSDFLSASNYSAQLIAQNLVQTNKGAGSIVSSWQSEQSKSLENVRNGEYKDLGVGIATYQGVDIYVIVFAKSLEDFFNENTADLQDINTVRALMLERLNQERLAQGLSALSFDPQLQIAAQGHADDMLNRSYYAHETPEGLTSHDRILATNYDAMLTGENIAKGQFSVQEVMDAWMDSPAHRDNILTADFEEVGIGMALGKNLNGYEVIWVQNFGTEF